MVDPKTIEDVAFRSYYDQGGSVPRRQGGQEVKSEGRIFRDPEPFCRRGRPDSSIRSRFKSIMHPALIGIIQ
jgi:hypothetical protein